MTDARARLRSAQVEVLGSLQRGNGFPAGFDPHQLGRAAEALLRKRASAVAAAWPMMAQALGATYADHFRAYVRLFPSPPSTESSSLADGRRFARVLAREGVLPDIGRAQALWFDLCYRFRGEQLSVRRGAGVSAVRLRESGQLMVGFRLPRVGVKVVTVPLRISWRRRRSG